MPDYCYRIRVKPEDWSPHRYTFETAWLLLFARADSEESAGQLMTKYLHLEALEILERAEFVQVDISKVSPSDEIETSLARSGLFGQYHMGVPPLTQQFSKN